MKNILVRVFGFPATLIHGDPLVLDRWNWLKKNLPVTRNGETFLDIGCGSGAFTIGAALRGYKALGLSWDVRNQTVAAERAAICHTPSCDFEVQDVRRLNERQDLLQKYDVVINFENIEHLINDRKLIIDISECMKPGGFLVLTSPNYFYKHISPGDLGPFPLVEDGSHMRRGYTPKMLEELCLEAGLVVEKIDYCSGFFSQALARIQVSLGRVSSKLAWLFILPLRPLPILFDRLIHGIFKYPYFTICMLAYKPRFKKS